MWTYNHTYSPALTHYGILGMKWGVRRTQQQLDRLAGRIKEQQAKRAEIRSTKGVGSKSYAKASKELNLTRARFDLQKAKKEGDATGKIIAKNRIKDAKSVKKHGAAGRVSSEMRRIFGSNLSKRELEAVSINEWRTMVGKERTKKILNTAGIVAIPLLSAAVIAEGKYYVENGRFGKPSVGFENGQIMVKVR
jgi:hypothetical protein